MKSVVCVKLVPDSSARISLDGEMVSWGDAPLILNPWDEYAMEAALRQKESLGGTVSVVTIGGQGACEALKRALAMGADEALLVEDPLLTGMDTQGAARVLAAVICKIGGVEMAFFGRQSIDDESGVVAAQTARLLGWAALTLASVIQVEGRTVRVERSMEEGRQVVTSLLPVVFSLTKDYGEPRYPSFMGIRKAANAAIPTWSLADLGLPPPHTIVERVQVSLPSTREVTCEFITGSNVSEQAEALAEKVREEVRK